MNLFYQPKMADGLNTLDKEESGHIVRVLRKVPGDIIRFTDGGGYFYDCRLVNADARACVVEVVKKHEGTDGRDYHLHLAVAPTKNIGRFEWFLEKATEIGVDRITPFISHHSERKVIKRDRLEKVIISAMKQSLKSNLPQLDELVSFQEVIQLNAPEKYVAYIDETVNDELARKYSRGNNVLILIGPEGDFDPGEVEMAKEKGFVPVSLGPSRLRTETAAIVACHTVNLLNG